MDCSQLFSGWREQRSVKQTNLADTCVCQKAYTSVSLLTSCGLKVAYAVGNELPDQGFARVVSERLDLLQYVRVAGYCRPTFGKSVEINHAKLRKSVEIGTSKVRKSVEFTVLQLRKSVS